MLQLFPDDAAAVLDAGADFTSRVLFESAEISVTLEHCMRHDHSMSAEECCDEHVMIFPLAGVNVLHVEDEPFVVSPSHVTLLNRGEVYRVSHPHGSGEASVHVALGEHLLMQSLASRQVDEGSDRPFSRSQVARSPELHLQVLRLLECVPSGTAEAGTAEAETVEPEPVDAFCAEELTLDLADSVSQALGLEQRAPLAQATSGDDRELACATATLLAARYTDNLSLGQVAQSLGVSKFHLCRVFKRVTGDTIWQRLQQIRARAAATELAAGLDDLTQLALALGFSSHSHFTASFRREFGMTPSALRSRHGVGLSDQPGAV